MASQLPAHLRAPSPVGAERARELLVDTKAGRDLGMAFVLVLDDDATALRPDLQRAYPRALIMLKADVPKWESAQRNAYLERVQWREEMGD